MNEKKLNFFDYVLYMLLGMPLAILGLPLYIHLPTYYATDVGVNIAVVGTVLFAARLLDVITDPLIGIFSDFSVKKFATRKPVAVFGGFILLISFYFLIHPHHEYPIAWLFIFSIAVYMGWSMVYIPYLSWGSELSNCYEDTTKLNGFREFSTILGLILALVLPAFFSTEIIHEKLNILFVLFAILFISFLSVSALKLQVTSVAHSSSFTFGELKKIYISLPSLKSLQLGYFLNNFANALPATLFLLFIDLVIGANKQSDIVLIVYFVSGVLALPFWMFIANKTSKKTTWIASMVLASLSFAFVITLGSGDLYQFVLISIISGFSLGADIAFPTAIHSDLVQKQKKYAGVLFGLWTTITKLALAFSVVVAFGILGLIDFDQNNPTETSLTVLAILYGVLPVLIKFIAFMVIKRLKEN